MVPVVGKGAAGSDLAVLEESVLEAAGGATLLLSRRAQRKQQWHRSGPGFWAAESSCEADRHSLGEEKRSSEVRLHCARQSVWEVVTALSASHGTF